MAQIITVELSRDKLIEILTPIFKENGVLDNKNKITDFMITLDENHRFESMQVMMVPKSAKTVSLKKSLKFTWKYLVPKKPKNARWEQELFRTIYTVCVKASNELGSKWNGSAEKREYLEADSMTIACLQSMEQFEMGNGPNRSIGTLGRFNVFRNLEALDNYIYITGANGNARIELDFSKMPIAPMK